MYICNIINYLCYTLKTCPIYKEVHNTSHKPFKASELVKLSQISNKEKVKHEFFKLNLN